MHKSGGPSNVPVTVCLKGLVLKASCMAQYRVFRVENSCSELQGRSTIKSQNSTGYVRRVRSEALVIADRAPDPPQEDLQPAVLKAWAVLAVP